MGKKPPSLLTPEERELFQSSVKINQPLPQDKHHLSKQPVSNKRARSTPCAPAVPMGHSQDYLEKLSPDDWLTAEDYIHFARTGIPHRTLIKLKRGLLPLMARIDLHMLTGDEMLATMAQFLDDCQLQGKRHVLVVHGKGSGEPNKPPVLKNLLNAWLRRLPMVLAFYSAKPSDGGTGALYILLKSRK